MNVNNEESSRISFAAIAMEQKNNNEVSLKSLSGARDTIFQLGSIVGQMCSIFLNVPHDSIECTERPSLNDDPFWLEESEGKNEVATQLGKVFIQLFATASVCGIDLCTSILKKVELNGRKYPVELCKVCFHCCKYMVIFGFGAHCTLLTTTVHIYHQGKSGKYTNYSAQTGITTTEGQSTIDSPTKAASSEMEDTTTVEGITYLIRHFANARLWNRFHTPRNIALALLGEVGELAELFQWKGDVGEIELTEEELDKIGQEIADVSIYLIRLADVCHIRLGEKTMQLLNSKS